LVIQKNTPWLVWFRQQYFSYIVASVLLVEKTSRWQT